MKNTRGQIFTWNTRHVVFFPKRQKKIGPLILPDENIDSPYEPIDHHVGGHVFGSENFQKCQPESGFRPLREFQNSTFSYKSQHSCQIVLASQSGSLYQLEGATQNIRFRT